MIKKYLNKIISYIYLLFLFIYFLGRIYHSLGKLVQAVAFLEQGLTAVDSLGSPDDEAALRLGLGLALWDTG